MTIAQATSTASNVLSFSSRITMQTKLVLCSTSPSVSVEEIADMLEIDLTIMGDKKSFQQRLLHALNAAVNFGTEKKSASENGKRTLKIH